MPFLPWKTLTDSGSDILGDARLEALGDAATKLPFTMTLDTHGRLTNASVVTPATGKFPAFTFTFVYRYSSVTSRRRQPARSKPSPRSTSGAATEPAGPRFRNGRHAARTPSGAVAGYALSRHDGLTGFSFDRG
ncbi:hypothetical protein [Paractinoplanes globisporus]|uniref:Uncharacterized protein n=1 Tax=Paractinoplanes globisporus TaxID=113565 RepID=A0ABW6WX84_9ACTN|nr:hypothetical protein [Actinoplanes globisporus]